MRVFSGLQQLRVSFALELFNTWLTSGDWREIREQTETETSVFNIQSLQGDTVRKHGKQ